MPTNIKKVNYTHGKRSAPKHLQQNLQPIHYSTQNSYLNPEFIFKPRSMHLQAKQKWHHYSRFYQFQTNRC
jgi:hypothetical protein